MALPGASQRFSPISSTVAHGAQEAFSNPLATLSELWKKRETAVTTKRVRDFLQRAVKGSIRFDERSLIALLRGEDSPQFLHAAGARQKECFGWTKLSPTEFDPMNETGMVWAQHGVAVKALWHCRNGWRLHVGNREIPVPPDSPMHLFLHDRSHFVNLKALIDNGQLAGRNLHPRRPINYYKLYRHALEALSQDTTAKGPERPSLNWVGALREKLKPKYRCIEELISKDPTIQLHMGDHDAWITVSDSPKFFESNTRMTVDFRGASVTSYLEHSGQLGTQKVPDTKTRTFLRALTAITEKQIKEISAVIIALFERCDIHAIPLDTALIREITSQSTLSIIRHNSGTSPLAQWSVDQEVPPAVTLHTPTISINATPNRTGWSIQVLAPSVLIRSFKNGDNPHSMEVVTERTFPSGSTVSQFLENIVGESLLHSPIGSRVGVR